MKPLLILILKVVLIFAVTSSAFGTALHKAVMKNDIAEVKRLLEAGADVAAKNESGHTPLHFAAENGFAASVKALLEAGADPNVPDKDGDTPLDKASRYDNNTAVVNLLKSAGALSRNPAECPDPDEQADANR